MVQDAQPHVHHPCAKGGSANADRRCCFMDTVLDGCFGRHAMVVHAWAHGTITVFGERGV